MKRYICSLGAVMLLGSCVPVMAQGYFGPGPDHPLHWYVDGGFTATTGWDPLTGLGSLNFGPLSAALLALP